MRGSHISFSWFSAGSSILVELKFGDVGFCGGKQTGEPDEKTQSKARTNNKHNPHMTLGGNRIRAKLVVGERSAIPAPLPV